MSKFTKNHSLRRQISRMNLKSVSGGRLVSLNDYKQIKNYQEKITILVVDEDEINIQIIRKILNQRGYRTLTAFDGMELTANLETQVVDLILLNSQLPWVDGYQICRLLKSDQLYRQIPVVLLLAAEKPDLIQKGEEAGANDWLSKPLQDNLLLNKVQALVDSENQVKTPS